ncbi:MAG TPA: hypothetical protein VIH11_07865, partial [Gemmatimonadaceae bacterium]
MPIVRRAQREVGIGTLPGVRKRAAATPESEGAGVERARIDSSLALAGFGERVARAGVGVFARLQDDERQAANETALLKADNRLSDWKNARLYDPDRGALALQGEAAFPLPEQLRTDFDQVAGEIEKGLGNDAQRAAFQRLRSREWQSVDLQIRRHVFTEMQAFRAGELKSLVENASNAAILSAADPKLVAVELDKAVTAIRTNGPRLGLGAETIEAQVRAVQSGVHVGVISQLLAQENERGAQAYFEAVRGQIDGDKMDQVLKALEEGSLRREGQVKADAIVRAGGTLTEQREQAKAIDDPKLREGVLQLIEHEDAVTKRVQQQANEDLLDQVYARLNASGGDMRRITPSERVTLGKHLPELEKYARTKAKGEPVETDLGTYYDLVQQAMDDPAGFSHVGLLRYRAKLDDGDFKHLASVQLAIRSGDTRKADKELGGARTINQIMAETVGDADPKSPRVLAFRRELDRRVEAAQIAAGN